MKPKAFGPAVLVAGPLIALAAACGYCHGQENLAICAFACLGALVAGGILAFVGLVALGWLGALVFKGTRGLISSVR